jgi:hypothetical protein
MSRPEFDRNLRGPSVRMYAEATFFRQGKFLCGPSIKKTRDFRPEEQERQAKSLTSSNPVLPAIQSSIVFLCTNFDAKVRICRA